MALTVSKDANNEGKFSFEVYNGFDLVEFGGNYPTFSEAEQAGQFAYRALHMNGFSHRGPAIQNDYITFDDIMAELDE